MSNYRVIRGGSCYSFAWNLRSTFRDGSEPEYRSMNYGFRIVVIRGKQ